MAKKKGNVTQFPEDQRTKSLRAIIEDVANTCRARRFIPEEMEDSLNRVYAIAWLINHQTEDGAMCFEPIRDATNMMLDELDGLVAWNSAREKRDKDRENREKEWENRGKE